jgi:hypothetical protein
LPQSFAGGQAMGFDGFAQRGQGVKGLGGHKRNFI